MPVNPIQPAEYLSRQDRARRLIRDHGFPALIAWSRAGSTQDHYADAYFLSGFYTHQPFVPDLAIAVGVDRPPSWRWRAAGHTAAVVPTDGLVTVVVDTDNCQVPPPVADRIVVSSDPVRGR